MAYCFINGDIMPVSEARIKINDLGLLRAYSVFDYFRTYNGKPFRIEDHLERFQNSAGSLNLPLEYSEEQIIEIVDKLLKLSGQKEAGIRLLLTGGYSPDGMTVVKPNFLVIIEQFVEPPAEDYENGVKLVTMDYQRDVPSIKSTNYLNAIRSQALKKNENAHDILYCNGNDILELTRCNFFIFKGETLITPKEGVLLGITRKVVLEIASGKFTIEERGLGLSELEEATEAFLTGTSKKIVSVVRVDTIQIGDGEVGTNTKTLMQLIDEFTGS